MTDPKSTLLDRLADVSAKTAKVQHEGLDLLLGTISSYRASLRNSPTNGLGRVQFLKDANQLLGMLACADGRQNAFHELRAEANKGLFDPTFDELVEQDQADQREGLVNEVLAAADGIVDLGLVPRNHQAALAVAELEIAVFELFAFDEELDESDDDDDDTEVDIPFVRSIDYGSKPATSTVILPPAMTIYERKELETFFRSLGISI